MKLRLPQFAWIAVAAIAAGAAAVGCDGAEEDARAAAKGPRVEVEQAVVVEVAPADVRDFTVHGDYAGEFAADETAELSFEVAGRIAEIGYDIGDVVEAGEVLARIDALTYRQQAREAQANLEMARASVAEATVAAENLEADLARKEPLLDKNVISAREIEDLRSRLAQARQKVAVSQATIAQAEARLASARENLRNTSLRAPFGGRIAARYADLGTTVSAGQPVFRLVSEGDPHVRLQIPEKDVGRIAIGKPVELRIGAMGGEVVAGQIVRVAPALDPKTRTLRVDVGLKDQPEVQAKAKGEGEGQGQAEAKGEEASGSDGEQPISVMPGMYAQARIELGRVSQAVTVPRQAVREARGGAPYVWAVADGKADRREVRLGLEGRERVQVVDGVGADGQVIIRGFDKLQPGAEVKPIASSAAQEAQ